MEQKLPAFQFMGYRIVEINLKKTKKDPNALAMRIADAKLDEKTNVYSLLIHFVIDFGAEKPSYANFGASFKINNLDWFHQSNRTIIESMFVTNVFPYIKHTVEMITSDSAGNIVVPTFDFSHVDMRKGVTMTRNAQTGQTPPPPFQN